MTWEELVLRDDIVGGDLEIYDGRHIYRGPITRVRLGRGQVYFELEWVARREKDGLGGWKARECSSYSFVTTTLPSDIGDKRLQFFDPVWGLGIIFPKGGAKLDYARVERREVP